MRSYDQYCAVARALDVVGDRWALLVVRELLLRRRCRYRDLQDGLPGISTNVLTERLRDLVDAGVVRRVDPSPPIATPLYELASRGTELAPVLHALGTWGTALMAAPQGDDAFRGHWLAFPISRLADSSPNDPPVTIQVHAGGELIVVETDHGAVRANPGRATAADAELDGPPDLVLAVLRGELPVAEAEACGVRVAGDVKVLARLVPATTSPVGCVPATTHEGGNP
jgi:DNA-binding HxlR family transcriptional regulator